MPVTEIRAETAPLAETSVRVGRSREPGRARASRVAPAPRSPASRDLRLVVLGALLVAAVFLASNLHYTGGELVLPLDDAYIYAQYARALAEGHAFRFTPGGEPTAGITGILYPFLIAPLYLVGLRGSAFPAAIFAFQAAAFAISAVMLYLLAGSDGSRYRARLAAALFVCSGPLAWGFLSGMEIGLFVALWTFGALALVRKKTGAAVAGTALLTLVRPDGLAWAGLLWLFLPRMEAPGRARRRSVLVWLVPIAVGLVPLAINFALTGGPAPASGRPKSPINLPGHHLPTIVQHVVGFVITATKGLLSGLGGGEVGGSLNGLDSWSHVPPFTLLLLAVAVPVSLAAGWRARRAGALALSAAWLLLGLAFVAVTTGSATHFFRYLLPVWPALAVMTAEGARLAAIPFRAREPGERGVRGALAAYLVAFTLLGGITFSLLYGKAAHGFSRQYVDAARWSADNLPPDARIASLDAGIIGYFAEREFFDLYGLTTRSMHDVTVFFAEDEGSKFEVMERLPPEERPTHFILHEQRFLTENWNPWRSLMRASAEGRPAILRESRVMIPVPLIGRNLQVWPADWTLAGSGDFPGDALPGRLVDRVDVADPESELAHAWTIVPSAPGFVGSNRFGKRSAPDGRIVMDGGRGISGRVALRLEGASPGEPLFVKLRLLPTGLDDDLDVWIDGRPAGTWRLPHGGDGWQEPLYRISGSLITGTEIELVMEGTLMLYHVWAAVPG